MQMTQVTKHRAARADEGRDGHAEPARRALTLLAVGHLDPASEGAGGSELYYAEFHEVGAALLALHAPDVVLSPLVAPGFDCFDLAAVLVGAGFRGRYRAAAVQIPDPGLVRREIAAAFPGLDFDILLLDGSGRPAIN